MLKITSDNLTNAGKHVTSNITCARSQQYAQKIQSSEMTLSFIRLHISHLSNQMSFQMVQQTGCRYVNYHKRKHADANKQDRAKETSLQLLVQCSVSCITCAAFSTMSRRCCRSSPSLSSSSRILPCHVQHNTEHTR